MFQPAQHVKSENFAKRFWINSIYLFQLIILPLPTNNLCFICYYLVNKQTNPQNFKKPLLPYTDFP